MRLGMTGIGVAVAISLLATACGQDDGSAVRVIGGDGSETAASGAITGSGSQAASGVATECVPVGDPESAETTVGVAVSEWSIESDAIEVAAGAVAFDVGNDGAEAHEVVVIRADTPAADLPTTEEGAVDEDAIDGEAIGEVEPFPSGERCIGVFDLEPGSYALVCNIVEQEDGATEAHYAEGMLADFIVSG